MPTYHYRCKACKHEFEEIQGMAEDPLKKCPKCGKKKLVRIISGAGLVFKGSGFYLTDYKKQGSSHSDASREAKPSEGADGGAKSPRGGEKESKSPGEGRKGKGGSSPGAPSRPRD
jgi:putative FmdB family regulatory protein